MPKQRVRVLTHPRKGKGNIVLMPNYNKGEIVDFDSKKRRYIVKHEDGTSESHPRNIFPEK